MDSNGLRLLRAGASRGARARGQARCSPPRETGYGRSVGSALPAPPRRLGALDGLALEGAHVGEALFDSACRALDHLNEAPARFRQLAARTDEPDRVEHGVERILEIVHEVGEPRLARIGAARLPRR